MALTAGNNAGMLRLNPVEWARGLNMDLTANRPSGEVSKLTLVYTRVTYTHSSLERLNVCNSKAGSCPSNREQTKITRNIIGTSGVGKSLCGADGIKLPSNHWPSVFQGRSTPFSWLVLY
jgi:hypothetical protein